ncbi:HAD family hydrolase [Helicovermis profundi]|uniref:HAD family hydrolase n=1 Tax=Helicovermis profundi TaxID=3065157 RepID=A0AAU9EWP2_9FIRM|nr:HAD family hydrolase [Clostridia bacterium S502]
MFKNIKTIFFDFDGTLHNGKKVYIPAFKEGYKYLVENGYADEKEFSSQEVAMWLGYNEKDMWNTFMPNLPESIQKKASKIIGSTMDKLVEKGEASLFDESIDTLKYLKEKGYTLLFLSNCTESYKDFSIINFKLQDYFDDYLTAERFNNIPKEDIIKKVMSKYKMDMVMIGDRFHDIKAGKENDLYTIGCSYGYGSKDELKEADTIIASIGELKNIL